MKALTSFFVWLFGSLAWSAELALHGDWSAACHRFAWLCFAFGVGEALAHVAREVPRWLDIRDGRRQAVALEAARLRAFNEDRARERGA